MARTKAEIDLLREGFLKAYEARCEHPFSCSVCRGCAAMAYPYPTRLREVKCSWGTTYRRSAGVVEYRSPFTTVWTASAYSLEDIERFASLLDADTLRRIADSGKCGPTEEVDDTFESV